MVAKAFPPSGDGGYGDDGTWGATGSLSASLRWERKFSLSSVAADPI
jgi:hypothetical protein